MAKIRYFAAPKWLATALMVATVCACGNKGELYRPEPEGASARVSGGLSKSRNAIRVSLPTYLDTALRLGPIARR